VSVRPSIEAVRGWLAAIGHQGPPLQDKEAHDSNDSYRKIVLGGYLHVAKA
jgi:hypothetical protein